VSVAAPRLSRTLESAPVGASAFAASSKLAAGSAFALLFAGGMVTSTGSGLAVPDWPLSFGTLNPPMIGGVFFEHGHRVFAGAVALVTWASAALSRRPGVPAAARAAAWAAAAAVLVQALLGGLTVLLRLPPAVSISHALLGQGVFCLLLAAAVLASPAYAALPRNAAAADSARFALAGFAAAYLQLGLGALIRHLGAGAAWHIVWAFVVLALALASAAAALRSGSDGLRRSALVLAGLLPFQLALGFLALKLRSDPTLSFGFQAAALWRTAHLSGGAAALGAFLALALLARRAARPA